MAPDSRPEAPEDQRLSELLAKWKVQSSLPLGFQNHVWQRIVAGKAQRAEGRWRLVARWIEGLFAQPTMAVAYVAILLFVGLGAGLLQAHGQIVHSEANWEARYVQSVDPYQMPRP